MAETMGLIAAMAMEARAILRRFSPWKPFRIHGLPAYRLAIAGADCVLIESGMGTDKAAAATEALLKDVSPRSLVSFGIAGAVETGIRIGDVMVARHATSFEGGKLSAGRPLAALSQTAYRAAERALEAHGVRLYVGTTITTAGPQPPLSLLKSWMHPILDMETAAIARVAAAYKIPLVSIRSISDSPDQPLPMALEDLIDENGGMRIGHIAGRCLRHPSLLLALIRVGKNGAKAAENAAPVVAEMLADAQRSGAS
jgi:adenosylhomocysteine nucleosidase